MLTKITAAFQENIAVQERMLPLLQGPILVAIQILFSALSQNRKVLICGNGGSAAEAQHFSAELVARFETERSGLSAIALTADTALLTAISNDYGFQNVFSRQVRALGQVGDILLVLTTSSNSINIVHAVQAAQEKKMHIIALTGENNGLIKNLLRMEDIHVAVPSRHTARIQETHLLLLHCICAGIDYLFEEKVVL